MRQGTGLSEEGGLSARKWLGTERPEAAKKRIKCEEIKS